MFSTLGQITTYNSLQQAGARLLYADVFNQDTGIANWINQDSQINYQCNKAHTLSLYIEGGYQTTRTDCNLGYGFKGAICLLPENSNSSWFVDGDINLFHFYFTDKVIRRFVAKTYDIEPLMIQMPELTFRSNSYLEKMIYMLFKSATDESHLKKEAAITNLFDTLLSSCLTIKNNYRPKGGLSPVMNRKIKDFIESHLNQNITLNKLSSVTGLSEFHLQRMFKQTNGITPHDYLMELRIEKAKSLFGKLSLSQISVECGFSHQSHMNRIFKQKTGITPLQYYSELES